MSRCVWVLVTSLPVFCSVRSALAVPAYAIHRIGSSSAPGDFVRFDTNDPGAGQLLGNIGLENIGTMDFFDGTLWVASGTDNVLRFYTVNTATLETTLQSEFLGGFGGTSVFSGSFDQDGHYWVVDFVNDLIREMNPNDGKSLHSAPIESNRGYNGIAWVGETLYAVQGATGDPPQMFGTLDPMTGAFSAIGRTYVGVGGDGGGNGTGALDYDETTDSLFLVYRAGIESGQFWSLYTVDVGTGAATFVDEIQPERNYDAFAVVPEPSTIALLAAGLFGVTWRRRTS